MTKINDTNILNIVLTGYAKTLTEMTYGEKFYTSCHVVTYVAPIPESNRAYVVVEHGRVTTMYENGIEYKMVERVD